MADLVAFLEAEFGRAEQLVRVISHGGYEAQTWHLEPSRSGHWVQVVSKSRTLGEPPEAAMRDDDQPVALVTNGRNEHLLMARNDPASVLRRVKADRAILADLLAERHLVVDGDCWFTCTAATEDRDGGACCDDDRRGGPCDCGRDARVERRVRLLAESWGWEETG